MPHAWAGMSMMYFQCVVPSVMSEPVPVGLGEEGEPFTVAEPPPESVNASLSTKMPVTAPSCRVPVVLASIWLIIYPVAPDVPPVTNSPLVKLADCASKGNATSRHSQTNRTQ